MQYGIQEFSFLPSTPRNSSALWETQVYRTKSQLLCKETEPLLCYLTSFNTPGNGIIYSSSKLLSFSSSFPSSKPPFSSFHLTDSFSFKASFGLDIISRSFLNSLLLASLIPHPTSASEGTHTEGTTFVTRLSPSRLWPPLGQGQNLTPPFIPGPSHVWGT